MRTGEVVKFEPTVTANGGALWPSKPKEIEMGAVTNAAIAKWQEEAGIEPARGDLADMLKRIADLAAEIITLTALESSGIRDGDGCWHGSDPLDGYIERIYGLWTTFDHNSNKFGSGCEPVPLPSEADNEIPF